MGGEGVDLLIGGEGDDTLHGDEGSDYYFDFNSYDGEMKVEKSHYDENYKYPPQCFLNSTSSNSGLDTT